MVEQSRRSDERTEFDAGDQSGRTVLITGANSGLGLHTATVLAAAGAHVLLACRSAERGNQAWATVAEVATGKPPQLVTVDLGELRSVHECAREVTEITDNQLHLLINNAGVMATPKGSTKDGFERQFGTNHLGHAALTWLLMPALRASAEQARIVTVSSVAAAQGTINIDDPNFERRAYNPMAGYGQAKLANQVFALELDRRLRAADEPIISVAAHPGLTSTGLTGNMVGSYRNPLISSVLNVGAWVSDTFLAQNVERGALPQLYAATAHDLAGGDYIGPDGFRQLRGLPRPVRPLSPARDPELGARLWALTASLTGIQPDPA